MLSCLIARAFASSASGVTFEFEAGQPGFPNPSTAFGSMQIELSLVDSIALPDGAFMVQLGVDATAEMTTDSFDGDQ
jgi:hypothetical protein